MRISGWSSDVCSSDLAGAVGSAVVQIAKAREMTVIGAAGGAEKCAWVRELGADAAVDYKARPVLDGLAAALHTLGKPGIDVYFDNVGGDHLRSEEHTSELQSLMRISYAVFCLNKQQNTT